MTRKKINKHMYNPYVVIWTYMNLAVSVMVVEEHQKCIQNIKTHQIFQNLTLILGNHKIYMYF